MPVDRLYLIDSFSLIFRAYYANMKLKNGAAYTFTRMLLAILKQHSPSHIACVFDTPEPTFRHKIFPEYKANRAEMPEDLRPQIPIVKELVQSLGIPIVELSGFEADDVMGALAKMAANQKIPVAIVSPDKDLLQLVDDTADIKVLNNRDGEIWIDRTAVKEKFGVWPEQIVDFLTLVGDSSDNVKGVPGIGEKGARDLLETHLTLENILTSKETLKPKQRSGLEQAAPWLELTHTLVTIRTDLSLPVDIKDLTYSGWNTSSALAAFKGINFETLVKEFTSEETASNIERRYTYAKTMRDVELAVAECRKAGRFALDTETTCLEATRGHMVGLSLAWTANEGLYIPLAHLAPAENSEEGALPGLFGGTGLPESLLDLKGDTDKFWEALAPYLDKRNLPLPSVRAALTPLFADHDIGKYGQNIKHDLQVLSRHGFVINGISHDSMVLSFILGSANRHNLDLLSSKHLNIKPIAFESIVGKGKTQVRFDEADFEQAVQYAAEDADLTLQLVEKLAPQLTDKDLIRLYRDIDLPLVLVLTDLEKTGIRVDLNVLTELARQFNDEKAAAEAGIFELAGEKFNPASPAQLGRILYEVLGLPILQRTAKTKAPSTDEYVLQELARREDGEIARLLLRHRQMSKLLGTYVEALPQLINPLTGRVHTKLHQAAVATGRLASSDPNLQNIPIRTKEGRAIRGAFVPEPGWVLLDADYSQIELRVVAALAKDPVLLGAFERGEDIHRRTASEVMGITMEAVTPEQRSRAKAVNFGLLYGQGAFALSAALGITHQEAKSFIESYFERMPFVAKWIENAKTHAIKEGIVRTAWGRVRTIPELLSTNTQLRNQGLREAVNTIVQGTAADIMRRAMVRLHRSLREHKLRTRLLLQVHDELLLEAPPDEATAATEILKAAMEGADDLNPLGVRLEAEVRHGSNWLECK
ncbi:MAG: DNA polymerase I [Holophagales bacterium]|jgi:DNA polymerase-1|nr:DNA polymerase I [Holophagales bacterium]